MQKFSSRRYFLKSVAIGSTALVMPSLTRCSPSSQSKPNVLVIFCDDLGFGDLGTFGHPTIRTPNLDRMAAKGQKWTSFYAAASVCTPSRAGLMTGRLPVRSGMCSDFRRVLFPDSANGLPQSEITIARALKTVGYNTACIGKWHLGHLPEFLPTSHGFDYYFGIPYSNDMDKIRSLSLEEQLDPKIENYNVPLMRNEKIIERPADQHTITKRYTEEAIKFIAEHKESPWFIYLAHTMVHIPLFASEKFRNTSRRGLFGDTVEEIDAGIGRILQTLVETGQEKNTMIVFTSDNGPWLPFREHSGSAGLLRDGKGTTWEGGMREPTIFYWPGKINPAVVPDIGSTLDLFATIVTLAGGAIPTDREMDSYDLAPALFENNKSPRNEMYYYRGQQLFAVRQGAYKAHFITMSEYQQDNKRQEHDPPLLFNLDVDPGENYECSAKVPDVVDTIKKLAEKHKSELIKGEDQLIARIQDAES
ncbi:arylsulfatase [candidate division KSB1 bacterium]|nr:sulfatase [candidate division KSB1 bacterium]RQW04269.1 MAG: arylsulfatase [candidate division KSB1 bacterium]